MRPRALRLGLGILALALAAAGAGAEWRSLGTDAFVVLYPRGFEETARELLAWCEAARPSVEQLTGGSFRRLPLVVQDLGTYGNGLANPVLGAVRLYPYEPPASGEIGFAEWPLRSLAIHELAHMGQLGAASGLPGLLRAALGPLLAPGLLSPAWLTEGIAILAESASSPYEGRLNDGTFGALVALQARAGALPSIASATFSSEAYPFGTGRYLYGAAFVRYLVERGGDDALPRYLARVAGSPASYLSPAVPLAGADRFAREVWGEPLRPLWDAWREAAADGAPPSGSGPPVGPRGAADLSGLEASADGLFYVRSDVTRVGAGTAASRWRIVRLDDAGREHTVAAPASPVTAGCEVHDGRLYYAVMEFEGGHANVQWSGWGVTSALRVRDLSAGSDREILRAPLRCFTVLSDGRVLFAVDGARGSELMELTAMGSRLVRSLEVRVMDLDADGGSLVLCARRPGANTDILRLDLAELETGPLEVVVASPWSESTLSLAGGRLLYTTNEGGRNELWSVDLADGTRRRYETGTHARWPAEDPSSGTVWYVGLTAEGPRVMNAGRPGAAAEASPDAAGTGRTAGAAPVAVRPAAAPPEVAARPGGPWPGLVTLLPRIRLPVLWTDLRSVRAGLWLSGESALGVFGYDARGWYDSVLRGPAVEAEVRLRPPGPVLVDLTYVSADAHALEAWLGVTPFRRLQAGVSSLGLGVSATARDAFGRVDLEPEAWLGWRAPLARGGAGVSAPIGLMALGSPTDRIGVAASTWAEVLLLGGELSWRLDGGWSSHGGESLLPVLRGRLTPAAGSPGLGAGLRYRHVLLPVRDGLWNPAVYVGDLEIGLFGELSWTPRELGVVAGLEAAVEVRLLALGQGLPLTFGAWAGLDDRLAFVWGLTAGADVPSLGGGRRAEPGPR